MLPSSAPQVKLHCSGEGRFRGVAVSESRGNTSRSVESGSDSLMVSGDGEMGIATFAETGRLAIDAGVSISDTDAICTCAGSVTSTTTHSIELTGTGDNG